jgi:signal transducing adaptor molecule
MHESLATELARGAEQEVAIFSQAMNVEDLLNMLRALDPAKDYLTDDEEIEIGIIIFSCSLYVANV